MLDTNGTVVLRDLTYGYALTDNMTSITDAQSALNNETFGYTPREHLASATGPYGSIGYTYDGVGNRTAQALNPGTGLLTDTYIYPTTNNQLQSIALGAGGTRSFTYDAAGNVTYDNRSGQGYGYTYDNAGRMASFSLNGVVQAEYRYNQLGQQITRRLTQTGVTIHSVYGPDGNRIAEYNEATGALIREYVWLEGAPVAVVEGGVISFVRSDHIGRPVFATNSSGTKTWTAAYLPFGGVRVSTGTPPTARFPGQWFQSETGLHQNWMRDYDPTTGRYMQADPLGLVDGASVYGYARQSPGRYVDPTGLASNLDPMPPDSPYCQNLLRRLANLSREISRREGDLRIGGLPQNFPGAAHRFTMTGHRYLLGRAWRLYFDTFNEWSDRCGGGGGMCVAAEEPQSVPVPSSPNPQSFSWPNVPVMGMGGLGAIRRLLPGGGGGRPLGLSIPPEPLLNF